jgi:propanediol dehydratase small subunit
VPGEVILDLYTALRPHRSTEAELRAWVARLQTEYGAHATAAFVADAADAYAERGFLAR